LEILIKNFFFRLAFMQILINIMNATFPEKMKNQILESLGAALSELAIALIPLFNIFSFKAKTDFHQRKRIIIILHFFTLAFIFGGFIGLNVYKSIQANIYIQQHKAIQNPHNSGLSSFESIELIFITIVSFLLLKYKYFIHHIIAIIIFIFISFFIDLILDNFPDLFDRGVIFIFISIIIVAIDAIDYGYQKYMMDVLFYPYWSLALIIGITNFFIFSTLLIACLAKGKENSFKEKNQMFIGFYKYFEEVNVGIIIVKHILNIILNFFLNLFRVLTILYFTPDYILISFTISRIIDIIIESKKYECLALFFLQFITLMFYLEIFEFNFCGLNKNTRRNIQEREKDEMLSQERISRTSEIDASPDYIVNIINKDDGAFDINEETNENSIHAIELQEKIEHE
jgi:hypothetical protein